MKRKPTVQLCKCDRLWTALSPRVAILRQRWNRNTATAKTGECATFCESHGNPTCPAGSYCPKRLAGIRVGVGKPPRLGSLRTAMPSVCEVFANLRFGVIISPCLGIRVQRHSHCRTHKGFDRRYSPEKRGFAYNLAQTSKGLKGQYSCGFAGC